MCVYELATRSKIEVDYTLHHLIDSIAKFIKGDKFDNEEFTRNFVSTYVNKKLEKHNKDESSSFYVVLDQVVILDFNNYTYDQKYDHLKEMFEYNYEAGILDDNSKIINVELGVIAKGVPITILKPGDY